VTQEESELLANATLARDNLRTEEAQLERSIDSMEIRLEMVRELLAMLDGKSADRPVRTRTKPRRAAAPAPVTQPTLSEQEPANGS
jgi:hypothetical protein